MRVVFDIYNPALWVLTLPLGINRAANALRDISGKRGIYRKKNEALVIEESRSTTSQNVPERKKHPVDVTTRLD